MRPPGMPPARPMQANSQLRGTSPKAGAASRPPSSGVAPRLVGKAPPSPRIPPGAGAGVSPRNSAAMAAASSVLGSERAHPAPPPLTAHGGTATGADKRMNVFKNRYLDDARDAARRMQLLDLVKVSVGVPCVYRCIPCFFAVDAVSLSFVVPSLSLCCILRPCFNIGPSPPFSLDSHLPLFPSSPCHPKSGCRLCGSLLTITHRCSQHQTSGRLRRLTLCGQDKDS